MTVFQGQWTIAPGARFAIVVSRFNEAISQALLQGTVNTLERLGLSRDAILIVWVPGAFEIPGMARRLMEQVDAIITLGAVIRGETPHFDYVATAVASGVAELAHQGQKPVVFGVLTCNTVEEAQSRAGGKAGNKGSDVALAAVEMVSLYQQLSGA